MSNRPNGSNGTDVLSFVIGVATALGVVVCAFVIRLIVCGWEARILP